MCKPVSLFIRLIPQRIRRRMKARKATAKAEAAAKISQLTLNRYKKLLGTQYISQQDYDTAPADAQQANAAVVAAKAAVETARINPGLYQSDLPYQRSYW